MQSEFILLRLLRLPPLPPPLTSVSCLRQKFLLAVVLVVVILLLPQMRFAVREGERERERVEQWRQGGAEGGKAESN